MCSTEDKARYKRELDAFRADNPHITVASPTTAPKTTANNKGKSSAAKKTKGKTSAAAKGPKRKAQKKQQDEKIEWDSDDEDVLVEQALAELADLSDEEDVVPTARNTKTLSVHGLKSTNTKKNEQGASTKPASRSSAHHRGTKTPTAALQLTSPTGKQRSASSAGRMKSMAVAAAAVKGASRTQKRKVPPPFFLVSLNVCTIYS